MKRTLYRAWVDGISNMIYCTGDFSITFDGSKDALITMWCSDGPVDEFTSEKVMQSTGLKDKNGALIYEGDIVQWTEPYNKGIDTGLIEWDETFAGFGITGDHCLDWNDTIVVIGNIHENPELIGG